MNTFKKRDGNSGYYDQKDNQYSMLLRNKVGRKKSRENENTRYRLLFKERKNIGKGQEYYLTKT